MLCVSGKYWNTCGKKGASPDADCSTHSLKAVPRWNVLLQAGMISICPQEEEESEEEKEQEALLAPPPPPYELTEEQRKAVDACRAELDKAARGERATPHLIYGVTGSGKTAVYLELARLCLERRQDGTASRPGSGILRSSCDATCKRASPACPSFLFHGYQSPARRERIFRELAARREPCLVVGTRSALFLPVSDPGLIVLDEEHDTSFKQDEGLHYQAKEVAWCRTALSGGLLVFGSATPDVKTFYAAKQGELSLTCLPHRVGGSNLPAIELVDISRDAMNGGDGLPGPGLAGSSAGNGATRGSRPWCCSIGGAMLR